jgi:hypothetical protein
VVATDVRLAGRRLRAPHVTARAASVTVGYGVMVLSLVVIATVGPERLARGPVGSMRAAISTVVWSLVILAFHARTRCPVPPPSRDSVPLGALSALTRVVCRTGEPR